MPPHDQNTLHDLTTPDALDAATQAPRAVLLKHGATCPISAAAREAVQEFAASHPDVPVYGIEVTAHRALSDLATERFGVPHESPQLFAVRDGRVQWCANHFDITPDRVATCLEG